MMANDEYQKEKQSFLDAHSERIKKLLAEKKDEYVQKQMKDCNWKEFAKKHMGGLGFVLIIAYFAWVKDIFSFGDIAAFVLVQLFISAFSYGEWKKEAELAALAAFDYKTQLIVRDYIWERMIECLDHAASEAEAGKVLEFYALAMYDIPRNVWFLNVYH